MDSRIKKMGKRSIKNVQVGKNDGIKKKYFLSNCREKSGSCIEKTFYRKN
jgi:hypothetical protein